MALSQVLPHGIKIITLQGSMYLSARVVAKRTEVSHHQHPNNGDMSGSHGYSTTSSTSYYVTFEVDSGDRIEFSMSGSEYGMLIEGDAGTLNFQGTRYLGFERK